MNAIRNTRDLQLFVQERLNADETLLTGGCRAFAEVVHDSILAAMTQLQEVGGVCLLVLTPRAERDGSRPGVGIPLRCTLTVSCQEIPEKNREDSDHLTANQAAERVALLLNNDRTITFDRFDSYSDDKTGLWTVSAVFGIHFTLSA